MFLSFIKLKHSFLYITELHKIKVSFLSQKPFQVSMQNEFQFYLIKPGITNCIFNPVKLFLSKSNSVFQTPMLFSYIFLNIPNHFYSELFNFVQVLFQSSPKPKMKPKWQAAVFKGLRAPRDLFFTFKIVIFAQTKQLN